MIESTASFRKRADTRYRKVGGEGIVVKQAAGEVLVLSEVGARILDLLEPELGVDGLLRTLAGEYEIDPATLERDVLAYLQELFDAEVIEIAPARAASADQPASPA
jgi:hypothetical protein